MSYIRQLDDDRMECTLCPRYCRLRDGQRGLCFVRKREHNDIVLTTYGRASGFCIDPIEKKPLHHFFPGSPVLSFGTAGCNLTCSFCQNWDISKSREMDRLQQEASPESIAQVAAQHHCLSVAFTYNDPVIFIEYASDTALACHERGIKTVAVTAGYITDHARPDFFKHIDAANVDLKAFSDSFYRQEASGQLQPVLDTLKYLKEDTNVWFEITTLLIPGKNDSDNELHAMSEWISSTLGSDIPLHFTAFHPDWKLRDVPPTPPATLTRARAIAQSHGLHYVYTGNVHDPEGGSTYCSGCQKILIGRDWYKLSEWNVDENGNCLFCTAPLPGHFMKSPGNWGSKRLPINVSA